MSTATKDSAISLCIVKHENKRELHISNCNTLTDISIGLFRGLDLLKPYPTLVPKQSELLKRNGLESN